MAGWLSFHLQTKWLWVRFPLGTLKDALHQEGLLYFKRHNFILKRHKKLSKLCEYDAFSNYHSYWKLLRDRKKRPSKNLSPSCIRSTAGALSSTTQNVLTPQKHVALSMFDLITKVVLEVLLQTRKRLSINILGWQLKILI